MEEQEVIIIHEKYKVLSGSALKCIALLTMIIDHVNSHLLRDTKIVLMLIGQRALTLNSLLNRMGRLAFPIYCFPLTEGFLHTHNRKKYGRNLLLFALISEIPWNLEHSGTLYYPNQNVFFTLFLGFLGLCCVEDLRDKPHRQLTCLLILVITSWYLRADYGLAGFGFILLLHCLRNDRILQAVIGTSLLTLSGKLAAGLAFVPINLYNGKRGFIRGRVLKYAFYAAYPVHLFVIYLIKKKLVGF